MKSELCFADWWPTAHFISLLRAPYLPSFGRCGCHIIGNSPTWLLLRVVRLVAALGEADNPLKHPLKSSRGALPASHIWPKEGQIWGTTQFSPMRDMNSQLWYFVLQLTENREWRRVRTSVTSGGIDAGRDGGRACRKSRPRAAGEPGVRRTDGQRQPSTAWIRATTLKVFPAGVDSCEGDSGEEGDEGEARVGR